MSAIQILSSMPTMQIRTFHQFLPQSTRICGAYHPPQLELLGHQLQLSLLTIWQKTRHQFLPPSTTGCRIHLGPQLDLTAYQILLFASKIQLKTGQQLLHRRPTCCRARRPNHQESMAHLIVTSMFPIPFPYRVPLKLQTLSHSQPHRVLQKSYRPLTIRLLRMRRLRAVALLNFCISYPKC